MHALTTDEIDRLSPEERLALIGELWDSLDDSDVPLTPAQTAELERRLANFESERDSGVTWEALKTELRQRQP
jgi:putative addiction module component (TIGR02574 family)